MTIRGKGLERAIMNLRRGMLSLADAAKVNAYIEGLEDELEAARKAESDAVDAASEFTNAACERRDERDAARLLAEQRAEHMRRLAKRLAEAYITVDVWHKAFRALRMDCADRTRERDEARAEVERLRCRYEEG